MIASRRTFADRESLASALAADVAAKLKATATTSGKAVLAVSGGTTPKLFFAHLSRKPLAWEKVTVTLIDERCVPETSERSNARLVHQHLLVNNAMRATFVPLFGNTARASRLGPFDVAVLGMGSDGHTASFFPGGDHLAQALDLKEPARIVTTAARGDGELRLTFTLAAILEARFLALHIEGEEKLRTLEAALQEGPVEEMPIRAVLRSAHPVTVYWSA